MPKNKKKIKKAYHQGREEGFDKGLQVAKMLYADAVADLVREVERLNSEIILGEDDELSEDNIESD